MWTADSRGDARKPKRSKQIRVFVSRLNHRLNHPSLTEQSCPFQSVTDSSTDSDEITTLLTDKSYNQIYKESGSVCRWVNEEQLPPV